MTAKVLRNYSLTIDAVEYAGQTSQVVFVPPQAVEWTGGAGNVEVDYDTSAAQVTIGYADDDAAASLVRVLADPARWGDKVACVWKPQGAAAGPTYTSEITLGPGQIGGSVGGFRANTVTLRSTWPTIADPI